MRVLWDWRLFSYGYRNRGIGIYCSRLAQGILASNPTCRIFIWGDRSCVPPELHHDSFTWIPYSRGSWKSSIFVIPYLMFRYNIDIIHYWVALGPLRDIGIAPLHTGTAIATIYDIGVACWNTPYSNTIKKSAYWAAQKLFFSSVQGILSISHATQQDLTCFFAARTTAQQHAVTYVPFDTEPGNRQIASVKRQSYFITLAGSLHKNCAAVIAAFANVRKKHPLYKLIILGALDPIEEGCTHLPPGVSHEPSMAQYTHHLCHCSGLLFCSLHEGLGIPPLEAMQAGCPMVLSAIPSLRETCSGAACFVDPHRIASIEEGIFVLIRDNLFWQEQAIRGASAYAALSHDAAAICIAMYRHIYTGTTASPDRKQENR